MIYGIDGRHDTDDPPEILHALTSHELGDNQMLVTDPAVVAWLDLPRPACDECGRPMASWGPRDPTLWRCFTCHRDQETTT
jgi:hypothetical protein